MAEEEHVTGAGEHSTWVGEQSTWAGEHKAGEHKAGEHKAGEHKATSPAAGGVRGVSPRQREILPASAADEHFFMLASLPPL
jgi:hypothetical protein